MAPAPVSPEQQHAQLAIPTKKVAEPAPGSATLSKPLADLMGQWDKFSFAPIRESTVSRAMTRRCTYPHLSFPLSFPSNVIYSRGGKKRSIA